jgi:hypothetical protein
MHARAGRACAAGGGGGAAPPPAGALRSAAMEERASDQDREQAAEQIRDHYAAGRLTDDELDSRVQAAYGAQTTAELRRLLADLPVLPEVRKQQERAALVERRSQLQRRLLQQAGGSVIAFAICTGIWVAAGASGSFWPIWIALIAVIGLVKSGWDLYGPAPDLDAVEAKLDQKRERGSQRDQRRLDRDDRREQRRLERADRRGRR